METAWLLRTECSKLNAVCGPEVFFKTCVAMKFVDDDDDDERKANPVGFQVWIWMGHPELDTSKESRRQPPRIPRPGGGAQG